MTAFTLGVDTIWVNKDSLPAGLQWAGYSTGTGIVPWPISYLDANPNILRYCQDPGATDTTADVLDVETGAATVNDCPGWLTHARANFRAVTRPGQRWPAIYVNGSNITAVANILNTAHTTMPVPIILADYNLDQAQAISDVLAASGPFPLVGVQFSDRGAGGLYDLDIYETSWLHNTAKPTPPPAPKGPYRHVLSGSIDSFAITRNTTGLALLERSIPLWTDADKASIDSGHMVVYTENP